MPRRKTKCRSCNGSGVYDGHVSGPTCTTCQGKGFFYTKQKKKTMTPGQRVWAAQERARELEAKLERRSREVENFKETLRNDPVRVADLDGRTITQQDYDDLREWNDKCISVAGTNAAMAAVIQQLLKKPKGSPAETLKTIRKLLEVIKPIPFPD